MDLIQTLRTAGAVRDFLPDPLSDEVPVLLVVLADLRALAAVDRFMGPAVGDA